MKGKGKSNVLNIDSFNEVYVKTIKASPNYADSPAKRRYFANGFNQAIELYRHYLEEEGLSIREAERRALLIMDALLDDSTAKAFSSRSKKI
tara:strand:- start:566 stop:841 length:276 start_codon:yes stop_codon:yes gene_type:complete